MCCKAMKSGKNISSPFTQITNVCSFIFGESHEIVMSFESSVESLTNLVSKQASNAPWLRRAT